VLGDTEKQNLHALVMGKKNPEWNVTPEKELKVTVNIP
jgi:hypothetical protein